MSSALEIIKKRSSTRAYTAQPLTETELESVLLSGLQAPTATNRQELHFTVISGGNPILLEIEEEKMRQRGITPSGSFYYHAPVVILISGEAGFSWSFLDAGIAVENMALAAEDLGLGSVIIGCIRDALRGEKRAYFQKALQIPENYEFEIALALGHKASEKEPHSYDISRQVTFL